MPVWQANPQYLGYLVELLTAASTVSSTAQQQQITKSMDDFNTLPEADNYLLMLLADPSSTGSKVTEQIRGMAGLILKNNLRRRDVLSPETVVFFKSYGADASGLGSLIRALGDPMHLVRSTVGTVLSTLAMRLGRDLSVQWPELLPLLVQLARTSTGLEAEASAEALSKICEDSAEELVQDSSGSVDELIPALTAVMAHAHDERVRVHALTALNCFVLYCVDAFDENLGTFLQTLSQRASSDKSFRMRRAICQSLNLLLNGYPEEMQQVVPGVLDYMFENMRQREDESVSIEACEFWLSLVERDSAVDVVLPVLPKLLQILLQNMVYSDDDPDLDANDQEAHVPDNASSIKPRHHRSVLHCADQVPTEAGKLAADSDHDTVNENDENGNEDAEGEEDEASAWTIRKCSAATLDLLATTLPEEGIVPLILPLINQNMISSDWKLRECGILALGAISEGCMDAVVPHLPSVMPFLVESMKNSVPLVRAITAWTTSRYASWIEHSRGHFAHLSTSVLHAIISGMTDANKKVQHASSTALGVFADKSKGIVSENLPLIMQAIQFGLNSYQANNLVVLYDAIGTLADELGAELVASKSLPTILPLLIGKWTDTLQDDQSLFALLECMCSLSISAGSEMAPYAATMYRKSLAMVETTLKAAALSGDDGDLDYDFCIVALDLIGGLVQGLGDRLLPTIQQCSPALEVVVAKCAEEGQLAEVRQSAFALVGDMAQRCPSPLAPILDRLMHAILLNVDVMREDSSQGSANNAVWAAGELVMRFPQELGAQVPEFLPTLCRFLGYADNTVSRRYLENLAVTVGRCMSLTAPPQEFARMLGRWTHLISLVSDAVERETAWGPVAAALLARPQLIQPDSLPPLIKAVYLYRTPPAPLESCFARLLHTIKAQLIGPDSWQRYRAVELAEVPKDFDTRFGL